MTKTTPEKAADPAGEKLLKQDPSPQATARCSPTSSVSLGGLPAFAQSLLRVRVPVMVTLAAKKASTREVLELAPGAIVQFEKSCEEMLDVEIAGQRIGQGEAVKVGDKFGLRITSIILPGERFKNIQGKKHEEGVRREA